MKMGRVISGLVVGLTLILFQGQALAQEHTVVDAAGRKVVFHKARAERIVTSFKPVTLCALALKLNNRLVGVDTSSRKDKLQKAVFPGIARLADVGRKMTGLNFETLLSLKPDVVFMYAQKDGIKTADRLTAAGIPAVVVLPESFESLKDTLNLMARSVGQPELARTPIQAIDRVLDLAKQRVRGLETSQRKTVYFASPLGFLNTSSGNMLMNNIVEAAGGTMVSRELKGYFKDISPETFIKWNPDLVAVSARSTKLAKQTLARPEFKKVSAVTQGQVYLFPSNLAPWDFPSPLTALSVLWLGQKLYPVKFSDIDLIREIDDFHQTLFGKTFTAMGGKVSGRIVF